MERIRLKLNVGDELTVEVRSPTQKTTINDLRALESFLGDRSGSLTEGQVRWLAGVAVVMAATQGSTTDVDSEFIRKWLDGYDFVFEQRELTDVFTDAVEDVLFALSRNRKGAESIGRFVDQLQAADELPPGRVTPS